MDDLDAFVGSPNPLDILRSWFGKKAVPTVSQLKKKFPTLSHDFLAIFGSSMRQDEYTRAEVLSEYIQQHRLLGDDLEFRDMHSNKHDLHGHIRQKPGLINVACPPHTAEERGSVPCEVVLEFKVEPENDPFTDVRQANDSWALSVEDLPEEQTQILERLADYARTLFYGEFRTHVFMVFFAGDYARFIRWEHSVVVVSKRFDYVCDPFKLVAFFQAYANADAATRGWDTTVTALTPADEKGVKEQIDLHHAEYKDAFQSPLVRFDVRNGEETIQCIGSARPNFASDRLLGQATRCWIVYNTKSRTLMYYKRAWRITEHGLEPEGTVYERLHAAEVPHIPQVCAHGDIEGQWHKPTKRLYAQQHYELLIEEVGIRLTDFPTSRIAVSAIQDAMIAYEAALTKGSTMHRNISAGSILIWRDAKSNHHGLLADWDLSEVVTDDRSHSRYRSGTWPFISAHRQLRWKGGKKHTVEDDLESFVHVVTWLSIRYCDSNLDGDQVAWFLSRIYDRLEDQPRSKYINGGSSKAMYLLTGMCYLGLTGVRYLLIADNDPLTYLLATLRHLFEARYLATPHPIIARLRRPSEPAPIVQVRQPVQADALLGLFNEALSMSDWPADDEPYDRLQVDARTGLVLKGNTRPSRIAGNAKASEAAPATCPSSKRTYGEMAEAEALDGPSSLPTPRKDSPPLLKLRKVDAAD